MTNGNLDVVQGAYEAFGRGDVAAVLAALTEDVEWHAAPALLPHGMDASGREQVGEFFQKLTDTWEGFGIELDAFVASEDRVCVVGRASGRLDGAERSYGFVHAWTVRDGSLARFDEYVNAAPGASG